MELREAANRRRPGRYREYDGPIGAERPTFVHEDPTFDADLARHCAFPSLDTGYPGPGPSAVWKERKRLEAAAAKHPVIVVEGDGDGSDNSTSPSPPLSPMCHDADRLVLFVKRGTDRLGASITNRPKSPVPSSDGHGANHPQRKARTVHLARKAPPNFVPYSQFVPLATAEPDGDKFKIRDIGRQYPDWPGLTDGVKYVIIYDMTKNGMSFTRACDRLRLIGGEVTEMMELVIREKGKMQRNEEAIAQYDPLNNTEWLARMEESIRLQRARLNGDEDIAQVNEEPLLDNCQVHAPPREDLVTDSLPRTEIRKGKAFLNFMDLNDIATNLGAYQGTMGPEYDIPLNHFTEDGWENLGPHFRNGCLDGVFAMWKASRDAAKANPPPMSDSELHVRIDPPPGTLNPLRFAREPFVPEVIGTGLHPENLLEELPDGTFFNIKDGTVVESREEVRAKIAPAVPVAHHDIPIPTVENPGFDDPTVGDGLDHMDIDDLLDVSCFDDPIGLVSGWFQPNEPWEAAETVPQQDGPAILQEGAATIPQNGAATIPPQLPQSTINGTDNQLPGSDNRIAPPTLEEQFPPIDPRFLRSGSSLRDQSAPPVPDPPAIDPRFLTSISTLRERSPTVVEEVNDILRRYQHLLKASPPPKKTSRLSSILRSEVPGSELADELPAPPVTQKKKTQRRVRFEDDDYEDSDGEYKEPEKKNSPRGQKKNSPRGQKTQKAAPVAEPARSSGRKKQPIGNAFALEDSPAPRSTRRGSVFDYIPEMPVKGTRKEPVKETTKNTANKTSKESEEVSIDGSAQGAVLWPRVAQLQAQGCKPMDMVPKQTTSVSEQPANVTPSETRDKATKKSRALVSSPVQTPPPTTSAPVAMQLGTPTYSDPEPGSAPVSLSRPSRAQESTQQSQDSSLSAPAVEEDDSYLDMHADSTSALNWPQIFQSKNFELRGRFPPGLVGDDTSGRPPHVVATSSEGPAPNARKRKGSESTGLNPEGAKPAKRSKARKKNAEGADSMPGDRTTPVPFRRQSHTPIPIPVVPNFRSSVGSGAAASLRDITPQYVTAEFAAVSSRVTPQNIMNRQEIMGMGSARAEREILQNREMAMSRGSHGPVGQGNNTSPQLTSPAVFPPFSSMPLRTRAPPQGLTSIPPPNPYATAVSPETTGRPNDSTSGVSPRHPNFGPWESPSTATYRPVMGSSVPTPRAPGIPGNASSPTMGFGPLDRLNGPINATLQPPVVSSYGALRAAQVNPSSTAAATKTPTTGEARKPSFGAVATANILQAQLEKAKNAAQTTDLPSGGDGNGPPAGSDADVKKSEYQKLMAKILDKVLKQATETNTPRVTTDAPGNTMPVPGLPANTSVPAPTTMPKAPANKPALANKLALANTMPMPSAGNNPAPATTTVTPNAPAKTSTPAPMKVLFISHPPAGTILPGAASNTPAATPPPVRTNKWLPVGWEEQYRRYTHRCRELLPGCSACLFAALSGAWCFDGCAAGWAATFSGGCSARRSARNWASLSASCSTGCPTIPSASFSAVCSPCCSARYSTRCPASFPARPSASCLPGSPASCSAWYSASFPTECSARPPARFPSRCSACYSEVNNPTHLD